MCFLPGGNKLAQIWKFAKLSKHDTYTGVIDSAVSLFPEFLAASNTTAPIKNGIWDDNAFALPEPRLPCCCFPGFRR